MEPEKPNSSNSSSNFALILNRIPTGILSVFVAVFLLIIGSVAYRGLNNAPPSPTAQGISNTDQIEDWPVAPPTFTPSFTSTPQFTLTPTPTPTSTSTPTPTPSPTPTFTPTPIIISWQELGVLDTLEISTSTIVEETNPRWWLVPDAKVLVRATGIVQFGIDISQIENSTEVIGTKVEIFLPRAEVTSVVIVQTDVYDEEWFPNAEVGLNATQKAGTQIENWANEQEGLREIAEKLAKAQLEDFLGQLGFENVEIIFE